MPRTQQTVYASYFQEHYNLLKRIIDEYNNNRATTNLFSTNDYAIFNSIESGITKYSLRSYQLEALFILDYLLRCSDSKNEKRQLLEVVDAETNKKAPFLGYEMATGSGKTMLMGASIYFLNKKYGVNNFLIITPSSTDIYQKTIRNFTVGGYDSVWADDTSFTFNLITGDNYTQNLFFDKTKDANIFVFNISKFGTNATNTEKTWESAIWQDDNGNSVSIKQFLKGEKLIIITDEAHHHQSLVAKKIINNFHPDAVLEFTATAIESERGQNRKNQQVVYKYDIRRFLEDGHGKLVRAVALASETRRNRDEITQNEKLKLVTLFFIHLLKKKAVLLDPKCRELKPIAFVKVKEDTDYTRKIYEYIRNELADDLNNINIIIEKIKAQDLEITGLLTELYNENYLKNLELLRTDIRKSALNSIFYYGKSDKETEKKFLNIRRNEVEIVVYMQRLDEGIDLPNIYTMAVINDTDTNFHTSVKQIIGRGVRLNKDKREFDDLENSLKQQSEKLHIVCDQGRNFEEVIMKIQQEFGLNNKYLSFDKPKRPVINHAKSDLLKGKYVPHIKADFKAKEGVSLINLINDTSTIVERYLEENCFPGKNDDIKRFLKYRPDTFFLEVDIFSDKKVFHNQLLQNGGNPTTLTLTEKELKSIYGIVQKTLHCLPDSETVRKAFASYIDKFNQLQVKYYKIDDSDVKLATNLFVSSFSFFYRNHIEKNYFQLDFKQTAEADSWNLMKHFKDYELKIPEDQVTKNKHGKVKEKQVLVDLIEANYHFFGYEKSIYDYDKFDSFTELQLADYVDSVLKKDNSTTKPFWVRNQRNIYFTYGSKKYYPDFILFKGDFIYVIETKGEIFSDTKKNALLKRLDEVSGEGDIKGYKGLLIFSAQMEQMGDNYVDFNEFIKESEDILTRHQSKIDLVENPPEEEKYKKYIPAYEPLKAYKWFIKHQKTAKPAGWLQVAELSDGYPETVFTTQVKGNALAPLYKHNDWLVLTFGREASELGNKISLVYCEPINDAYDHGCTIRIIELHESKSSTRLFGDKEIHLKGLNLNTLPIILSNVDINQGIEIIGTIFESHTE